MKGIHDYISLTNAMLNDFSKLNFLDLTENNFLCNERVADFYELAEKVRIQNPGLLHSKVINLGSDTFGNPIFQKGLQNWPSFQIMSIPGCLA
jgi:hypothetical protein